MNSYLPLLNMQTFFVGYDEMIMIRGERISSTTVVFIYNERRDLSCIIINTSKRFFF